MDDVARLVPLDLLRMRRVARVSVNAPRLLGNLARRATRGAQRRGRTVPKRPVWVIVPSCLNDGRPLRPCVVMSSLAKSWEEHESDIVEEARGLTIKLMVVYAGCVGLGLSKLT